MPLPGDAGADRLRGRRGSYTPGEDALDSTPFKPVPLTFQQADGTMPADDMDRNGNAKRAATTRRQAAEAKEKRKKRICIAIVVIAILILLIVILSLSICLGTDLCSSSSSSSSSSEASTGERAYQVNLKGTLTSPIISDPGNAPFGEHVNSSLESNATLASNTSLDANSTSATTTPALINIRRRRDLDNATQVNRTYSAMENFVMEKINAPLLESIKSSSLCLDADCTDLKFHGFELENDIMRAKFNLNIGSDQPLSIDPSAMEDITNVTAHNFKDSFNQVFPGYRLGDVDLAFELLEFCNFTAVYCVNFTGINDTTPEPITPTTTLEMANVTDRSQLLPDIVQLWNESSSTSAATTEAPVPTMAASTVAPVGKGLANCSIYGFPCTNQQERVATRHRCDGILQCSDGSDEQLCESCRTSFSCPNGDGSWMCLRGKILCDTKQSCPSNYDEGPMFCKKTCLASEYRCQNSTICIPKRWLCDGDVQCPQGDDELGCTMQAKCNNNAVLCAADGRCVASWALCDGKPDCSDGSDEAKCSCLECSGNRTALCSAPSGKCILRKQVCDGKIDCPNGEDEMECSARP